jgi:hypothetical protein
MFAIGLILFLLFILLLPLLHILGVILLHIIMIRYNNNALL